MSEGISKEEMLELAQKVEDAVTEYNSKAELVGLEKMTYNNSAHAKYEIIQRGLESKELNSIVESDDVVVNIEEEVPDLETEALLEEVETAQLNADGASEVTQMDNGNDVEVASMEEVLEGEPVEEVVSE